jgi:hypothetical protein
VATDLLARIRGELDERLSQLRPLLSEYERLTAAAETLAAVGAAPLAAVDAEAETPYAGSPCAPPAREVPELPAEAPTPSAEAPRLPSEALGSAKEPPAPAPRRAYPLRGADGAVKLAMSLRTTPLQRPTPRSAAPPAAPAPSATRVLERPTPVPSAVEGDTWEPSTRVADSESRREPASPAAVRQAILAALEHGSHTPSELVMVTAMSTPEIRGGLIRLTGRGAITKVKRRGDGKTAYSLPLVRA